jgi:kynurenine formamidase
VSTDAPSSYESRQVPEVDEVRGYLEDGRNWGRWGADDQVGAPNLITDEKVRQATALVSAGRTISLSRTVVIPPDDDTESSPGYVMNHIEGRSGSGGGGSDDVLTLGCHGLTVTHLDALGHLWDGDGMWGGRSPDDAVTSRGLRWGGIEHWRNGLVTRGVLLDVPAHRKAPFVAVGEPVHGWELSDICAAQRTEVGAGDAVLVYGGRDAWEVVDPDGSTRPDRPGLHASCLKFLSERDASVLVWDMIDAAPHGYPIPWSVHGAISNFGLALVDNADLAPLAAICRADGRYEFMLVVAPLVVVGATGSPVNPLVIW